MIHSKTDLKYYLRIETKNHRSIFQKIKEVLCITTNSYIKVLRKMEYHHNNKGIIHKVLSFLYFLRWHRLSTFLGIYT